MTKVAVQTRAMVVALAAPLSVAFGSAAEVIQVPGDFATIQEAIVAASSGDEVLVAPGVYSEAIDFLGKELTVRSDGGAGVTTIDASEVGGSAITFDGGEGPETVLQGFTITGGIGTLRGERLLGGGVFIEGSSPKIIDCCISRNNGTFYFPQSGAGIFVGSGAPLIENCIIAENELGDAPTSSNSGAGMAIESSTPMLIGCIFHANDAFGFFTYGAKGGAIWIDESSTLTLVSCDFTDNVVASGMDNGTGAAIHNEGEACLTNCSFYANIAQMNGGGVFNAGRLVVSDCSFDDNSALNGAGIFNTEVLYGHTNGVAGSDAIWNSGTIRVGRPDQPDEYGVFRIDLPFDNAFGTVRARVGNEGQDTLVIPRELRVGGELVLEPAEALEQPDGEQFIIGTYETLDLGFSLVRSATFGQDQFLRVSYAGGADPAGGGIILATVDSLTGVLGFGDPESTGDFGGPLSVGSADFDPASENGNDLVVSVRGASEMEPGELFFFLNQGTEGGPWMGFAQALQIPVGREPASVAIEDFDGIRGPDVAVANAGDDSVFVLLNDGSEGGLSFTRAADIQVGSEPRAISAAKLDPGSIVDLAVASAGARTISILTGNGDGTFGETENLDGNDFPIDIDPSDLDNDKDLDLVVLTRTRAEEEEDKERVVAVHLNNGDGTFGPPIAFPISGNPQDDAQALETADLDGDSFVDILTTDPAENAITIALNLGGESFEGFLTPVREPLNGTPVALVAADLDADRDFDVAVITETGVPPRQLQVLENLLDGGEQLAFAPPITLATDGDPRLVTAVDVDADNIADLVTVSEPITGFTEGGDGPNESVSTLVNTTCACPADLTRDCRVDFADVIELLTAWGPCPDPCPPACDADLDEDCIVDFADVVQLLTAWGNCV